MSLKPPPTELASKPKSEDKLIDLRLKKGWPKGVPRHPDPLREFDGKHTRVKHRLDGSLEVQNRQTEEQKLFIATCIGYCMTSGEIAETFKKRFNFALYEPWTTIASYRRSRKWDAVIAETRTKYIADIQAVAGSHKRVRLDRLERLYEKAYDKNNLRAAMEVVDHQRKEMEEKAQYGSVNLTLNQYNSLTDEELEERRNLFLQKIKRIEKKEDLNGS